VTEATETRKDVHAEYQETVTLTQTAIVLIGKAKNRLQKFYNPTLYKGPPVKKEMTMEEKILAGASALAQIHTHITRRRRCRRCQRSGPTRTKTRRAVAS